MASHLLPYNEAERFRVKAVSNGLIDSNSSLEEQAARLSELTSNEKTRYDFSQLYNANDLVKARSWIHQKTVGAYDDYVDPLLKSALGDNSVSRVISGIGRGLVDSAPELATMIATRRPNSTALSKYAGNIMAGIGAGANALGQTGDTTTAMTNAVLSATTPMAVGAVNSLTSKIPALASRPVTQSAVGGIATSIPQSLISAAYTPNMQQLSEGGPVVATERVNPLDGKRALERIGETYSNPENIAIDLGGGALGDVAVGLAMKRQASAMKQNDLARNQLKGVSEIRKAPNDMLLEAGIRVPEKATATDVDTALSRLTTEGVASQESILRNLWQDTDNSRLTKDELEFKKRLFDTGLTEEDKQFMLDGNHKVTNNLADKSVAFMEKVVEDIDTSTYDPEKANPVSKFVDWVSRGFFNADEVTARNPAAKASIDVLKGLEANSAQEQNVQLIRLGQNRDGSLSNIDALNNLRNQLDVLAKDPELQKRFQDMLDKGNENVSAEVVLGPDGEKQFDSKGNLITRRRTIYEPIPETPVEKLMQDYNLTEDQAVFGKALMQQTAHNAKLRLEAGEYKLATKVGDALANALNLDRSKSLDAANVLMKIARRDIGIKSLSESGDFIEEAKPEIVKSISDNLKTLISKAGGAVGSEDYTNTIANVIYNGELTLLKDYAYNGRIGYTPMVRRGNFYVSYNVNDQPVFKGFKTKDEADSYVKRLKKEYDNIDITVIDGKATDMPVYNAISIAQAANLKRNISKAKHDLLSALTPEKLNLLDEKTRNLINDAFDDIEKNFAAANRAVAKASLYEKGTMFRRQGVQGASALDMVQNTIEMATQNARSAIYARDYATLDYLGKDPVLVNDPKLAKYVNEKIDYMNNPDTTEWRPVRSGAVLYYLAGSTSFLFQNLFQVPTLGLARWRNFTGRSSADFAKSLAGGSKLVHDYDHLGTKANKQDPVLMQCMKELENRKVFEQAYSQETTGRKRVQRTMQDIDSVTTKMDKVGRFSDDLIDWATQMVTASEGINRKWITASYLVSENNYKPLTKRSKAEIENVLRKASEISDAVNFTGGKATRPYFVQMLGKTKLHGAALSAMALQNYGLNLAAILTRQLRNLVPGLDSQKRIASKSYKQLSDSKGLMKTMVIMGALTGLYGLPGREPIDDAATKIFGEKYRVSRAAVKGINDLLEYIGLDEEGENGEQKAELRNTIVNVITYGLPALGNLHLSNLVSNPLSPTALFKDPNVSKILGASGQMFGRVHEFAKAVKDGNTRMALRQVPSMFNPVRKGTELMNTGTVTDVKGNMYAESKPRNFFETLGVIAGGMPVDVMNGMRQRNETNALSREVSERKTKGLDLAADVAHVPGALRNQYEKMVEAGLIVPDETAFIELVANRLAARDSKYQKQVPLTIVNSVNDIMKTYNIKPKYLSSMSKLKTALELAVEMQSGRAVVDLVDKLSGVDIGKSSLMERGVDGRLYSALMRGDTETMGYFDDGLGMFSDE